MNDTNQPDVALVAAADDGTLTTTSLIIAEGTGSQHESVMRLLDDNLSDFEEFGVLRFEIGKVEGQVGRPSRHAVLMEEHATLLLTYMRNSEVVKQFKKSLVRAFFDLRRRSVTELSRRDILTMALEAEDRADREAAARVAAERHAAALEAPASAWSHMAAAAGDYAVGDAAKILSRDPSISIGRDRLFAFMAGIGWVYRSGPRRSWTAYQTQVDCGRLVEKMGKPFLNERTGETELPAPTIRVTSKGLAELHKRLGGSGQVATMAVSA
ncbi:transcriptional regulator [Gordonia phage GMA4]|uniref:transcriptional regulator n=1 Tax=Gordonia phage GMA4 TaxID=1647471 RepID=UPI0006BDEBA5|nr:transcriptional regulator [Gordonia phage GMA4]AKJ72309.1 hypothetical protein GMA4_34 [Gordonia phage GMA4]